jgi:site-specific recombinase XerD
MKASAAVSDYVAHNRSLGKRFLWQATLLAAFVRSVGDPALHRITSAKIKAFVNHGEVRDINKRIRYRVLTRFFRHLVTRGRLKASPMPTMIWKRTEPPRTPHIYSECELKRLLAAAPDATRGRSHIDADTLRTFILLLYGAGLRRGEGLRLTIDDVDLTQSLIQIRETKFFKTRIVPISAELSTVLRPLVVKRRRDAGNGAAALFAKRDGSPLSIGAIKTTFKRLRRHAGLEREGDARNQPRLHDLRHTAAVHRVIAWYRSGADLNDLLPKLATYLGHKDLSGTQHYLTMTEELLAEASRRFETYARRTRRG